MNRQQRRAARKSKGAKLDREVAFHEAGHAVARYLTAADFGRQPADSIEYIEIGSGASAGASIDGKAAFLSQATIFGPTLSKEMQDIVTAAAMTVRTKDDLRFIFARAKAQGVVFDTDKWLRARALIAVFGGAAEAPVTKRLPHDVLDSYECEGDMRDFVGDCHVVCRADEAGLLWEEAIRRALTLLCRADVCEAVNGVALCLPVHGRVSGKLIISTIEAAMRDASST